WPRCSRTPRPPCRVACPRCAGRASGPVAGSRRSSDQAVVELCQLLVAVELDDDSAPLPGAGEGDLRPEPAAQVFLHPFEVGIEASRRRGGGGWAPVSEGPEEAPPLVDAL